MTARMNKNRPARKAACDLRHKIMYGLLGAVILTSLSACQLERFRHEKYSCQNSQLNIAEIIIRNAKKGKEVKIFGYDGERTGIIEEISRIMESRQRALEAIRHEETQGRESARKGHSATELVVLMRKFFGLGNS